MTYFERPRSQKQDGATDIFSESSTDYIINMTSQKNNRNNVFKKKKAHQMSLW